MRVGNICTRGPVCVPRDASLTEAARRMRAAHVGAVVVVERGGRDAVPVGMLTDRDVVVGVLAAEEEHFGLRAVGDVMGSKLVTAREDEDVVDVLERMRTGGVRRVPVVDGDGHLSGVLSIDDVVRALGRALEDVAAIMVGQRATERVERP
jgi:CBS domain-containing protein